MKHISEGCCFEPSRTRLARAWTMNLALIGIVAFAQPYPAAADPLANLGLSTDRPHYPPAVRPLLSQIPEGGIGRNFRLIGHEPLVRPGETLPRGGNGI